jgi:glucokinase
MTLLYNMDAEFHAALQQSGSSERYFLLIDQGGTNVRLRIYPANSRWAFPQQVWRQNRTIELRRSDIRSAEDLYALLAAIAEALSAGTDRAPEVRVVLACAGAVSAQRDRVEITNWPGQPVITLARLSPVLKQMPILLLNDVEAASFGLVALEEFDAWPERTCELTASGPRPIKRGADAGARLNQNRAVVMPGTGVGTALIIYASRFAGGRRSVWPEVVPSEVQHVPVSAIDAEETALIEWLRENRTGGSPPCFEAIVCGEGLENVYDFLLQRNQAASGPSPALLQVAAAPVRAVAIAHAARSNPPDPLCREALRFYYAFCGRLAQTLALAVKAFGGVYLAGDTTAHNWDFIPDSPYRHMFLTNHKQASLLQEFPLFLLDKPGINLDGALYVASKRWRLRHSLPE